ncbi:MAG: hypothetical protein ABJF01_00735 [bacterium]
MKSPGGGTAGGGGGGGVVGAAVGLGAVVCAGFAPTAPNTVVKDSPAGGARPGDDARGIVGDDGDDAGRPAGGARGGAVGRATGDADAGGTEGGDAGGTTGEAGLLGIAPNAEVKLPISPPGEGAGAAGRATD